VTIYDFKPFMYIELPLYAGGRRLEWNNKLAELVSKSLSKRLKDDAPTSCSLRMLKKLYYYRGDTTFPMLLVYFNTLSAMNRCINLLKERFLVEEISGTPLNFKCWETNIPVVRKLLTLKKANYSQWFRVRGQVPEEKESTLEREYVSSWKNLEPLDPSVTGGWVTHPMVMVIDIETYSANHDAFPDKYRSTDVAYMVSVVCQRYRRPETRTEHLIVIGDIPSFDNVETIGVKDEVQLCYALAELIKRIDPDIVTGYNIFAFDYDYLDIRLGKKAQEWPCMGRIIGEKSWMKRKTWESSAYGIQSINILMMEGRISIDMYPIIQRDYKLTKYDLDTVSRHFLGEGKHDVKAKRMFQIYKRYTESLDPTEMIEVSRYCVQDSLLVIKLMEKINVWVSLIEMSNVVAVPIIDIFTRGQQIRFLCQLYTEAHNRGIVLDSRPGVHESFKGGFIYDPRPGLYDYVICLDFSSLYPSIIRAYNICYTTLVPEESNIPDEKCHVLQWDEEGKNYRFRFVKEPKGLLPQMCENLVTQRKRVRKEIQGPLQDSGGNPRGDLTPEEEIVYLVAEMRQLALKVSANSIFGALGASNGYLPLNEGARSIAAMGKLLILQANDYLQRTYNAEIVYNDTDSAMVKLPFVNSNKEAIEWGLRLQTEISALYPPPLAMEFEKAGRMMPICKKRYSYWLIDRASYEFKVDSKGEPVLMNKGVILARRDNCKWQREVFERVLKMIMQGSHLFAVLDYVNDQILALVRGDIPWSKLTVVRTLGDNYTNENYFMNVFGKELEKIGKPMEPGSRLEYVIVEGGGPLGTKMRLIDTYLERRGTEMNERIDVIYYVEHMLMNSIQQLFEVGFKEDIAKLEEYYKNLGWYRIFTALANMGYGEYVNRALEGRSNEAAYEILRQTYGLKTKVTKLHSTYMGRKTGLTRVGKDWIKNQLKIHLMKKSVIEQLKTNLPNRC
jgi:DNA polymerase elongation subunit (family B)